MSQAPLDVTRLKHGFIFRDVTSQISLPNPPKPPNGLTGNTMKPREGDGGERLRKCFSRDRSDSARSPWNYLEKSRSFVGLNI